MTMADRIAVMRGGRIEQLGTPSELYEQPKTAFVAGFLGVSNLLYGSVSGETAVRLDGGAEVRVGRSALAGHSGEVAVGIRPEKIRLGGGEGNKLAGRVTEVAYVGVSTQYIVATPAGALTVYVQNAEPGSRRAAPGDPVDLSFNPDAAFVVSAAEKEEERE